MLKTAKKFILTTKRRPGGVRLRPWSISYSTATAAATGRVRALPPRRRLSRHVAPEPRKAGLVDAYGAYLYDLFNGAVSMPYWRGLGQVAARYLDHERYLGYLRHRMAVTKTRPAEPQEAEPAPANLDSFRMFIEQFESKPTETAPAGAQTSGAAVQKRPDEKPKQPSKLVLPLNVKLTPTLNAKAATAATVTTALTMAELEEKATGMCASLEQAGSLHFKALIIDDLKKLLYDHPEVRHSIYRKEKNVVTNLLKLRTFSTERNDKRLAGNINECLAMIGYVDQTAIRNRGINILSLDGGGAKGLNTIQILKCLQNYCGDRPLTEVFDYICGTSTGGIIGSILSVYKITLDECERQYKSFTTEMFSRSIAAGVSTLITNQAYYDTRVWETMLRERMGETLMINSARDEKMPKLSLVSARTTVNNIKLFLFRNYNLPSRAKSHYEGTSQHKVWEAIRASSAAPGYHEDFKLGGYLFQDGGLLANNPTAIALHEARQLWPSQPINCVVSIGNGRYKPAGYTDAKCNSINIAQKVTRLVDGLASTETVHTMCLDLFSPKVYFRFNPYMSEEFQLDENRPEKWSIMEYDTNMYIRRNDDKFRMAARQLLKRKSPWQVAKNLVNHQLYEF